MADAPPGYAFGSPEGFNFAEEPAPPGAEPDAPFLDPIELAAFAPAGGTAEAGPGRTGAKGAAKRRVGRARALEARVAALEAWMRDVEAAAAEAAAIIEGKAR